MQPSEPFDQITPPPRGALRHEVMRRLLRAIFEGQLPAGTRLLVMKIAERFGTSSTPVREALVELDALGVVEFVHNRGAVVAPFGPPQLRDIYHLRRILESEAARTACGNLDRAVLEELRGRMASLLEGRRDPRWPELASAADRRLHEMIAAGCANARLAREIHRYDTLVQSVREIIGDDRQAQQRALAEHLAIVDALRSGDAAAAAAAMARHVRSAAEVAEAAMFAGR